MRFRPSVGLRQQKQFPGCRPSKDGEFFEFFSLTILLFLLQIGRAIRRSWQELPVFLGSWS